VSSVVESGGSRFIKEDGWLDWERCMSYRAPLIFILGARSCGKTYAAKYAALTAWQERGEQFMYLRRTDAELKTVGSLFDDVDHPALEGRVVVAKGGDFNIYRKESDLDTGEEKMVWEGCLGHYMSLSRHQAIKGTAFPKVTLIVFDELIIEELRHHHYLPDEPHALMSIYFTVARSRENVRIVCLSNSARIANPWCEEYGVTAADFAKSEVTRRNRKKVVFICINDARVRNQALADIAPASYVAFAQANKFMDDTTSLLDPNALCYARPPTTFLVDADHIFGMYQMMSPKGYYLIRRRSGLKPKLTINRMVGGEDIRFSKWLSDYIGEALQQGRVRFDSIEARECILAHYKMEAI